MLNFIVIVIALSISFIAGAFFVYHFFIKTSDFFQIEFKQYSHKFEQQIATSVTSFNNQLDTANTNFVNNINLILQNAVAINNKIIKIHQSLIEFNQILESKKELENEIVKLKSIIKRMEKKS